MHLLPYIICTEKMEGCKNSRTSKSLNQMEGMNNYYMHAVNGDGLENKDGFFEMKKRVMVVVDQTSHSKQAMMWALTHVTNKADVLTLLHIVSPDSQSQNHTTSSSPNSCIATTLASLCKASKPEVEVEALVIQGPKMGTVISQVKKLEVSVLVLGQKKPSSLHKFLCLKSNTKEFVEECIDTLGCLTIGVEKQRNGIGGYLISTRWHKNFWLLA